MPGPIQCILTNCPFQVQVKEIVFIWKALKVTPIMGYSAVMHVSQGPSAR